MTSRFIVTQLTQDKSLHLVFILFGKKHSEIHVVVLWSPSADRKSVV